MPAEASVAEIATALGGEVLGDPALRLERIASLQSADAHSISFLAHNKFLPQLQASAAGCVILRPEHRDLAAARLAAILTPDPYLFYARLTQWWVQRQRAQQAPGVHPSAHIGQGVHLHPSARVGAFAVIDDGARIGAGVVVGPHCVVGPHAVLGEHTRLAARVSFGEHCRMGARGVIHSGAVIGADGFGFAPQAGTWTRIEQLGAVRLGDDVDIGANTCVDRGALDDTVLEDGVKLDNLIQIAHNVHIGEHTAMAGCVGVAGSARIGKHCTFGGAAMILGHLEIGDHVHISAASVVMSSITKPGQYSGVFPIDDNGAWEKNAATLRHLHTLRARLRALEKKFAS
ncbi:MAG: UDP-3-O-(3-hydroxymyristoyl)glucosamine N-acyltransferase [Ideonella sp. MAG2]|nr:MAG: UDP-3-O-(3-hydroxymyristoyl)glucosamine N-acyltransferase [Ideonella sp. MAG2]